MIKDFEKYLHESGYRLSTVRSIITITKLFISWSKKENINPKQTSYTDLLAYINYCTEQNNKKRTINGKLHSLQQFFKWLIEKKQREDNPATELRIKNTIRKIPHDLLKKEDLEDIYKNYPATGITGKRNKSMLGLLIYQGITTAELARIEVRDMKLEEGKIYIPSVGRSNSRILKLESQQIVQLQNYLLSVRPVLLILSEKQTEKLFLSTGKGQRLSNSYVRMLKHMKKINPTVKDLRQVRASIISTWLKEENIRQVQYKSGHRYVSSTDHYRTDKLETLQEQLENLHPLK